MNTKGQTGLLRDLSRADPALAVALKAIGEPVIRRRDGGLKGLARIIIQQQLSVASAQSILKRCQQTFELGDAETLIEMTEDELRACGLSRPKIRYLKEAALACREGRLDFTQIKAAPDTQALDHLLAIKGVGPWSAAIYLLFCEGRLSVWPPKDVALLAAYTHAAGLETRPPMTAFDDLASATFQPAPGLAAHVLWTYYGHIKNRAPV